MRKGKAKLIFTIYSEKGKKVKFYTQARYIISLFLFLHKIAFKEILKWWPAKRPWISLKGGIHKLRGEVCRWTLENPCLVKREQRVGIMSKIVHSRR